MIKYRHIDMGSWAQTYARTAQRCLQEAREIGGVDESEGVIQPGSRLDTIRAWTIPWQLEGELWTRAAFLESAALALHCQEPKTVLRASWQVREYQTRLPKTWQAIYEPIWLDVRNRMERVLERLTQHAPDTTESEVWSVEYSWTNDDGATFTNVCYVSVVSCPTELDATAYVHRSYSDQLGREVTPGRVVRGGW